MISKCFEIRDSGTFIPILAVKLQSDNEGDRFLLARAGFGRSSEEQAFYVQLVRINGGGGASHCSPYDWNNRTMQVAHKYIIENFDSLEPGEVIDVEFILGEKTEKKRSERYDA